ncbi:hypothetical protein [Amycolatopsis sp. EV170708-02-1]|uniref:hypothetical protein n=1 Tax=Amycolatopsis sp. EV170708-02-1 TaxID=2919322 RepID=UPI001F0C20D2|nr:hypothetical protein [Amycolatopsis sp. EV170708-02-1]UMP01290.1 hypothetical protein MJQ72_33355 [Amycolatopsis sp. EV170708-02-1]
MTANLAERPALSLWAAFRKFSVPRVPRTQYLVIPREAWLNQRPSIPDTEDDGQVEYDYYLEHDEKPISKSVVTGFGGGTASLVFGVTTGLVVATPVGIAVGVAAGIFGGLMGRSLAEEFYERRHEDETPL